MLFNSFSYLLFLPAVFILYWLSPVKYRKILLLVASYIFYMSWKAEYGLLLAGLTVANFAFANQISRAQSEEKTSKAKKILVAGLIFNIGCLCFYKYANFLLETLGSLLHLSGKVAHAPALENWSSPALNILLPLGISFFTFEFIHYIVDVHRGSKPLKNFLDFSLFASFFPSQIAGPIKRFQDFHKQMLAAPTFKNADFRQGMFLILQGLFKKVVLGDNLGLIVNKGFANVGAMSFSDAWITICCFFFQVFFDFSGYTDIGRGSALILGYKVPENFNLPYLAHSPADFWGRWHMSLSSWLRDYLYIPLGGSRRGEWITRRNTFITMALGGLWHGASWKFMFWGVIHGLGLVLTRVWAQFCERNALLSRLRPSPIWHWSGVVYTILFLIPTFIIFRAATLAEALLVFQRGFNFATINQPGAATASYLASTVIYTLPIYGLYSFLRHKALSLVKNQDNASAKPLQAVLNFWDRSLALRMVTCATTAIIIAGCAPSQLVPFIYFQF